MGNEMGNNNVSGLQEQEKGEFEAPNKYPEVPDMASDGNNLKAENQPVSSPKDEGFDETHKDSISDNPSGLDDAHEEKEESDNIAILDSDDIKEQAVDQSSKDLHLGNELNEEEIEPFSSSKDEAVDEIASASTKNPIETTENVIQVAQEPEVNEVQSLDESTKPPLVLDNTSADVTELVTEVLSPDEPTTPPLDSNDTNPDGTENSLSSEDGCCLETFSASEKDQSKPSDNEIQEQLIVGKEPGTTVSLAPDEPQMNTVLTEPKGEETRSVSSFDDGSGETATAPDSDKNTSEVIDQQVEKEIWSEREGDGEPEITSIAVDSEFVAAIDQNADQLKPSSVVDAEPTVEDEMVPEGGDVDFLGLPATHDSEVKGNELESESKIEQAGSAVRDNIQEVEKHGDDMQRKEIQSQGDALQCNWKTEEKNEETEVGVEIGEIFKTEPDSETNEDEPELLKLNLDKEDSAELQKDVVPVTESLESFQVEISQSKGKFVVLTDDKNMSENQSGVQQNEQNLNFVPAFVKLEEESEVEDSSKQMTIAVDHDDDNNMSENQSGIQLNEQSLNLVPASLKLEEVPEVEDSSNQMTIGVDHDDYDKGISTNELVKTDLQSSEDKVIGNSSDIPFHDNMDWGQEIEKLGEVSVCPAEFSVVDTNSQRVELPACSLPDTYVAQAAPGKEELQEHFTMDTKETVMTKPLSVNLDPIQLDTFLSVEAHSDDVKQELTAVSSELPENSFREAIRDVMLSDIEYSRNSNIELGSPDSNESYRTAYEQENLSPIVKLGSNSGFQFEEQIAETAATEMLVEEMDNKDANTGLETSDFIEVKHGVGRFDVESYSADLNMPDEVPRDERAEVPKQKPLQYEEKTISGNFRSNCFGSEINPSKVGISIQNPVKNTEFPALKEEKAKSDGKPSEDQILEEKQVITLGRTSSEKSNTPFLSFLREESYSSGSQEKQGKSVSKKWHSRDDKAMGITPRGGAKRKTKPLFFNIFMCCTTEVP